MAGDERGHPPGPYCHPTQGALSPSQNNFSETAFETQTPPGGYILRLWPLTPEGPGQPGLRRAGGSCPHTLWPTEILE